MVPVIALARSEAMKTAALATSCRVGRRPSTVPFSMYVLTSSASAVHVSGMASDRRQTTRIPCGPSSPAKLRESASMAAHAVPKPPVKWYLRSRPDSPAEDAERVRMTARSLSHHVPGRCRRCKEVRFDACQDRKSKVFAWHLNERGSLQISSDPNRVERDIYTTCLLYDRIEMMLDSLWIEGIDVSRLCCSSRDGYLLSQGVELW
jgi:hypothetical protein